MVCIFLFRVFSSLDNNMARSLLLGLTVPLYMVLSVQSALQNAMTEIVTEKESKMKIVQEIYGLTPTLYWLSWAGYFLVVSSVCVVAIYILLAIVEPVMAKSNPLLVLLLLLTSYLQQLEFAAIGSVFFNKLQTAAALSSVINILCLLLAEGMQGFLRAHPEAPRYLWYAGSLLPTGKPLRCSFHIYRILMQFRLLGGLEVNLFNGFAAVVYSEGLYYCNAKQCYQGAIAFASSF